MSSIEVLLVPIFKTLSHQDIGEITDTSVEMLNECNGRAEEEKKNFDATVEAKEHVSTANESGVPCLLSCRVLVPEID